MFYSGTNTLVAKAKNESECGCSFTCMLLEGEVMFKNLSCSSY